MANSKAAPGNEGNPWIKWACIAIAVVGLAFYFYPRSRVELDDQGYDASVALYRICNQKDTESLQTVAEQVAQWQTEGKLSEQSHASLQRVIDLADEGDWNQASRECRRMMEDQVQR
ncbi:hypothetical protein [Rhodopirellula bahusiensis]|uniref:Uncharacterized protein n=1 Tax=Rhodopirellula bahusiensis TaxID=2014065 RepID=A0A2G1W4C9_9BACT|nr:hypothetical protein [Rhodopirellula bahusiensis]PHQ33865.1 hypothetical protein CEE69_18285 [Rhodopirellula bahusiensis]